MKLQNHFIKIAAIAIFAAVSSHAYAQQTNFSGHWQLNKSKTDFGQAPEYVLSRALGIKQSAATLTVDRTNLSNSLDEKHYSEQISMDGKSTQTITISGNIEVDSLKSTAGAGVLALGIEIRNPANEHFLNIVESWTLEDNGNTLVIDKQVEEPNGATYEIKGYYDKQ